MFDWVKRTAKKISQAGGIFMFLRAQFSSQLASITDFSVTIILANTIITRSLAGEGYYVYATFIGALCGGCVNCMINYKWTFKSSSVKKRYVAIKYVLVWVGSLILNIYGTYLSTELLKTWVALQDFLGHLFDNVFIVCKLIVSLLVGFLWNYNMQRLFVYRNRNIGKIFKKKQNKQ